MDDSIQPTNSQEPQVRNYLKPGDIGYLIHLHGVLYAREVGWDQTFEAYMAGPLVEFAKSQRERERIWIVENGGKVAGSIGIVEAAADTAQLRWFLLHPGLRGRGLGKWLIEQAIQFCREKEYSRVFLLTTGELKAAAHLYRAAGFQLTDSLTYKLWGATVTEQRYDLRL